MNNPEARCFREQLVSVADEHTWNILCGFKIWSHKDYDDYKRSLVDSLHDEGIVSIVVFNIEWYFTYCRANSLMVDHDSFIAFQMRINQLRSKGTISCEDFSHAIEMFTPAEPLGLEAQNIFRSSSGRTIDDTLDLMSDII